MDNSELLSFFIDSLEIEDEDISIETMLDEIDEWDSIGVLSLIGAADDELGVDLAQGQPRVDVPFRCACRAVAVR